MRLSLLLPTAVIGLASVVATLADDVHHSEYDPAPAPPDPNTELELQEEWIISAPPSSSIEDCAPRCAWSAGYEFFFVRPHLNQNGAFAVGDPAGNVRDIPFGFDYDGSSRLWVSCYGECGALRARYWTFDDSTSRQADGPVEFGGFGGFPVPAGDTAQSMFAIELQTIDLEFIRDLSWARHHITVGVGMRYANVKQTTNMRALRNANLEASNMRIVKDESWGPTVSMDWIYPVACGDLAVYTNARATIGFGNSTFDLNPFNLGDPFRGTNDEVRTIGELGIGLSYHCHRFHNFPIVIRAGYEAQVWTDVGGLASDGDLGFEGFIVSVGTPL